MATSTPRPVSAKLPGASRKPSGFVNDLRQNVNNAKQSPDWDTTPQVQAAINVLTADAEAIEKSTIEIDQLRKQLVKAQETQAEQIIAARQHRKQAEAVITVASKGSILAVKAWGCEVVGRTPTLLTDEAPQSVSAKNTSTPGDVLVRCKGLRARAYVFQYAHDPTFPEGSPAPVVMPTATYTATGLPPGQRVYFRVAVVRTGSGQSKWCEPVQVTVR